MTDPTAPHEEGPHDEEGGPRYELSSAGHLDVHWSRWFGGLDVIHEDDGTTTLRGVVDQAGLHGLLAKVRDLGVTLVSLALVDTGGTAAPGTGRSDGPGRG